MSSHTNLLPPRFGVVGWCLVCSTSGAGLGSTERSPARLGCPLVGWLGRGLVAGGCGRVFMGGTSRACHALLGPETIRPWWGWFVLVALLLGWYAIAWPGPGVWVGCLRTVQWTRASLYVLLSRDSAYRGHACSSSSSLWGWGCVGVVVCKLIRAFGGCLGTRSR